MDWALVGFVLSVSTLVAAWFLRNRIKAYLGQALLEGVRAWLWIEETAEDGTRIRKPSPEFVGMVTSLAPHLLESAVKSVKFKPGGGSLPLAPGQPLDLSTIVSLLPKKYAPWVALALPMLERFGLKLPGSSSEASPPAGGGGGGWS